MIIRSGMECPRIPSVAFLACLLRYYNTNLIIINLLLLFAVEIIQIDQLFIFSINPIYFDHLVFFIDTVLWHF